jgi:RimJ/RimL family protein N-acetyltransferase
MHRIVIREAVPADARRVVAYMQRITHEPNNNILTGPGEFAFTVEEERDLIEEYSLTDNAIILVAEAEGELISLLHCRGGKRRAARHTASIGITVHSDWRGKGVGSAMMARVIEWATQNAIIKRLELEVFTTNERAIHVYEKFGFQMEGCKRRAYFKEGVFVDAYLMALLLES